MTPPWPPNRVDMRRTASCAAMKAPVVLTAKICCSRAGAMSTNLAARLTIPALLKKASSRPNSESMIRKSRAISSGLPISAWMVRALCPALRTSAATASAASLRVM